MRSAITGGPSASGSGASFHYPWWYLLLPKALRNPVPRAPRGVTVYNWIDPQARMALHAAGIHWEEQPRADFGGLFGAPRWRVHWPVVTQPRPRWYVNERRRLVELPSGQRLHHAALGKYTNLLSLQPYDTQYRDAFGTTAHPSMGPARRHVVHGVPPRATGA